MAVEQPSVGVGESGLVFDVARPFLCDWTVDKEEVDAQRHVNNAVYVRWMDHAAYAHSVALGYDWAAYQRIGGSFVVRRHEIEYLAPGHEGDRVAIATWLEDGEKFTAYRRHQFVRRGDGKTLIRAVTTWIYIDLKTGRPKRMPAELVEAFRASGSGG